MFKILFLAIGALAVAIIAVAFSSQPQNTSTVAKQEEPQRTVEQSAASPEVRNRIELPKVSVPLPSMDGIKPPAATTSALQAETPATTVPEPAVVPPLLNEEALLRAVVKIECPTSDGIGKYVGSGFVVGERNVVTAAHVIKDSASETCKIIFPRERKPVHYLKGTIQGLKETARRHDEEGIDVGILLLPSISSYPEALAIFPSYPSIPYPICDDTKMLGDKLLHFGYPSNYADQSYLSKLEGEAVINAGINGVEDKLSLDETYTYRSPVFSYTYDQSKMHPYMVSRVASFYGDSGGLAFNADKQCIIGPHRGGTIGKAAGENFSVFMNLGWEKAKSLLGP